MKRLSKLLFLAVALSLSWTMTKAQSSTITDGMVAYYPFNGNANDESGNGNNGTPMSSVTLTTGVGGDNNGAYLFGGYDNPGHISIPNSESLALSNAATISAYIKPTSWVSKDGYGRRVESGGVMCFFAKSHDRSGMVFLFSGKDEGINNFASCSNNTLDINYQSQGNYLNKWIHIAYVFTGNKVRLYVDGKQVAEKDHTSNFSVMNNQALYIGKYSDSWYPFNGAIDEVRMYNRALSANEIQQLANFSGSTVSAPSATTWEARNITSSSATLRAVVNPNGASTAYAFWWGTNSSSLDNHNNLTTLPAGTSNVSVEYELTGLTPNTTYYYQIAATNSAGVKRAAMRSFTTSNEASQLVFGTNVIMMTKGDAVELTYKSEIADGSNITWASDNNNVATVNSSGVISAVGDGLCKITASYDGKIQDKCTVFVGNVNESSDGHEYVDLGLPSGTQWAATNIGAETPEEYGDYFQWGDTIAKDDNVYSWTTYKFCNNSASALNKYCTDAAKWAGENNPDKLKELEVGDDVAYSQWGMAWRVPSLDQFKELVNSNYTTCERSMYNGVEGFLLTSRTNGKCIFLPAASHYDNGGLIEERTKGYYWSRTLSDNDNLAYELFLENSTASCNNMTSRSNGLPVRPVYQGIRDNANLSVSATQLDFGNVATGSSRSVKFNIVNNTYDNVEISPLSLQNKDFSIDWPGGNISPNSSQEVTVTYTPTLSSSSTGEALTVRTSSDSTIVNVVASSHTGSNELTTKENLVVWLKDGSKTTFVLNEKPIVTIGDKTLKVNGAKASAEYDFKDILRLTYDGMFPDDITKEISTTEAETDKPFTQTSEALVFSSDKEILDVKIVAVSGTVVKRFTVQDGSAVTLPLSQIPTGVYVINVNNISYKVSIR